MFWSGDAAEDTRKGLLGGGDGRGRRSLEPRRGNLGSTEGNLGVVEELHSEGVLQVLEEHPLPGSVDAGQFF